MLNRLKNIGFTRQDLLVISFLVLTFVSGLVIKYTALSPAPDFNYLESDRQFETSLKNSFSSLNKTSLSPQQQQRLNVLNNIKDSLSSAPDANRLSSKEIAIKRRININAALPDELMMLPGIGKSMAARIIEYRAEVKGFKKPEDLMNVKGIGEKKFAKLKDYISVE